MNKKLLIAIAGIIIIIGAAAVYVFLQKDTKTESSTPMGDVGRVDSQSSAVDTIKGKYLDYTEEDFASTKGTRLLFFHAPWCPQCRALNESIKTSELPDDLTIFKVDYDSNQALRAKYSVTLQTTVVKVDQSGNKIGSYVAYDEPNFQSVERALLP